MLVNTSPLQLTPIFHTLLCSFDTASQVDVLRENTTDKYAHSENDDSPPVCRDHWNDQSCPEHNRSNNDDSVPSLSFNHPLNVDLVPGMLCGRSGVLYILISELPIVHQNMASHCIDNAGLALSDCQNVLRYHL